MNKTSIVPDRANTLFSRMASLQNSILVEDYTEFTKLYPDVDLNETEFKKYCLDDMSTYFLMIAPVYDEINASDMNLDERIKYSDERIFSFLEYFEKIGLIKNNSLDKMSSLTKIAIIFSKFARLDSKKTLDGVVARFLPKKV